MRIRIVYIWLLLLVLPISSFSQVSTCEGSLALAQQNFDAGRLYGIPSLLKPCLDNGFNKNQKLQAYFLLTRTYLLIDDPISAEDSYLKLLKKDYLYEVNESNDPIDVVYLSQKFTTRPKFILFAKGGANLSKPEVIHNFGTDNTITSNERYESKVGFRFAVGSEYYYSDNFSIGVELNLSQMNYAYSNSIFNDDIQKFDETIQLLNVPVYIKYRFKFKQFFPFLYIGYSNDLILNSSASLSLQDRVISGEGGQQAIFNVEGPDISLTDQRNRYNTSVLAGLGVNYRVLDYYYIFFDLRYNLGLTNIVNIDNQYNNPELYTRYGYVDDYKKINSITASFGFIYPLYKPRKKKSYKIKFNDKNLKN